MIQHENSPTLCVGCVNFRKTFGYPGCAASEWSDTSYSALAIRDWLKRQTDELSWEHMGGCPGFERP